MQRTLTFFTACCLALCAPALMAQAQAPEPTPATAPAPTPAPVQPDDARLVKLVELVKAGLSENLIIEQIRRSQPAFNLTVNDLLYLKRNDVPENIIAALLNASSQSPFAAPTPQATPTPTPTPTPPAELTVDGLILDRGFGRVDYAGKLIFSQDTIRWVPRKQPSAGFELHPKGIREVSVTCRTVSQGKFCYQLVVKIAAGDSFEFEDEQRERGGNAAIEQAVKAFRELLPEVTVVEKIK